jgi:integrase
MKKNTTASGMKTHTTRYKFATSNRKTRIYKRSERGGWTFKTIVEKKVRYFPLGLDMEEALKLADTIRGHLMLYPFEEVFKMFNKKAFAKIKAPAPTFDQALAILVKNQKAVGLRDKSIKGYKDSLAGLIRKVIGKVPVDSFDLSKIDDDFIMEYKHNSLDGITDESKIASRMRSINSRIRQCKAFFSREKLFKDFDMSFVKCLRDAEFFTGVKIQYRLPSTDLIKSTFELWEDSTGDLNVLLGLALHFGMRRNEIFHARKSWFQMDGAKAKIRICSDLSFRPKGGHEGFTVGSKTVAANILNKASDDGYLIEERADSGRPLFDDALDKLRAIGWDRSSPLHELRKLFGSYIASTESIYIAQKFLRHADASTTNDAYADAILDGDILDLWAA